MSRRVQGILLFLLIATIVAVYSSTFASMLEVWQTSTFLHCYFVIPASLYLIWRERGALSGLPITDSKIGGLLLVLAVAAWSISGLAQLQLGQQFSAIAMLVSAVWAIMGTPIACELRFPLLFAFLAVPFGEFLVGYLIEWTAAFTVSAIRLTGIPVFIEGNRFWLPTGSFEVIEACSGMRYLAVTIAIGVLFARMTFSGFIKRMVTIAAMAAVMILANGVRAYLVVLVAHYSGMKYGTGIDHAVLGMVIFILFLMTSLLVGSRFADAAPERKPRSAGYPHSPLSLTRAPVGFFLLFLMLEGSVLAGPLMLEARLNASATALHSPKLPAPVTGWGGPFGKRLDYKPLFRDPTYELVGRYITDSRVVELYIEYYVEQRQGSELISRDNELFDGERWRIVSRARVEPVNLAQTLSVQPNEVFITDGTDYVLLWSWYDIGGHPTASPLLAKAWRTWNLLLGRDPGDALVVLATNVDVLDRDAAGRTMRAFLRRNGAHLQECLRSGSANGAPCVEALNYAPGHAQ